MPSPLTIAITGVSRGLGHAMTIGFAERGHRIFGCARDETSIAELSRELGNPHQFTSVDVRNDENVKKWAESVFSKEGPPDLLINCAALINRNAPLWKITENEFADVIDVNVKGLNNVLRAFLTRMIERGSGVIVNFSSGWGRSTSPEVAPYCASKWAVEGLTQSLAQELPEGLAAVAFNPGIIDTDMLRSCFGEGASQHPDALEWAKAAVPFLEALNPSDNGRALTCPGH